METLRDALLGSKAVFFDLFHTLFSFRSSGVAGVNTSKTLGIPEHVWDDLIFDSSDERMRGLVNDKYEIIRMLAHRYDPSISEEKIREAADSREERFNRALRQIPFERPEPIRSLKRAGKKIGLISNADSVEVAGWNESAFAPLFDSVTFSFAVQYVKPEREIFEIALQSLGVTAAESIFVGDGGSDELRGAKAVGFTTVFTSEIIGERWPEHVPERKAIADFTIASIDELRID